VTYRILPGYPLFGLWGREFAVTDANADGVITPAEVVPGTAYRFLGSPVPTRELGITPTVRFARAITVAALLDSRGGFRVINQSGRIRCNAVCAPLYVPNASLAEQARAVDSQDAFAAWIEDGAFVRLRELTVAWDIPRAWSRRVGARSSTLVVAGRNLATRTDYTGLDPEAAHTGQARIEQEDLFTLPLPRSVSVRLSVAW
jgi:hypothetical protein